MVYPYGFKAFKVKLLDIWRGRLHYYLELVVVLEAVWVFAVSSIGRTPGRFDVGNIPGLRTQDLQEGRRIKCPGPDLYVIRLAYETSFFCPVALE